MLFNYHHCQSLQQACNSIGLDQGYQPVTASVLQRAHTSLNITIDLLGINRVLVTTSKFLSIKQRSPYALLCSFHKIIFILKTTDLLLKTLLSTKDRHFCIKTHIFWLKHTYSDKNKHILVLLMLTILLRGKTIQVHLCISAANRETCNLSLCPNLLSS